MDPLIVIGIVLGVLLAINIGGNNSSVEFGPVYGAGISTKKHVLILSAIFSVIGALIASNKVIHTISVEIFDGTALKDNLIVAIAVLVSATAIIAFANKLRVPIATSHAMVGALAGAACYLGRANTGKLLEILAWWLVTPVVSLVVAFVCGRYFLREAAASTEGKGSLRGWAWFLTLSGCYQAFSAGSNSLAKAIAPVVAAEMMPLQIAVIVGGLGMGLGAIVIGPKLLETVGKEITVLDPVRAGFIQLISGTVVLVSSLYGIPVSLAEITTCAIIGMGSGKNGIKTTFNNRHIAVMAKLWPLCPILAAAGCFGLILLANVTFGLGTAPLVAGSGSALR
ncbi:MAG: inorganic phosphate transporter family protein [Candidatus Obscuribacterales bacterium]|nr:inorganic phosphate transporter family protein [Candidatus Obscuribacterales bacterium]